MKKLIAFMGIILMCGVAYSAPITVEAFVSPDDVSITHLEDFRSDVVNAINNADGDRLSYKTVSPDKLTDGANPEIRWSEAFNDWVVSGLTVPTSASLSSTTTAGTAYISGVRVEKASTLNAYTASKWTWVDLSSSGTYSYTETAFSGSEPALASNTIRLARVSSDTTTINSVLDMRFLSISLDTSQENFQRKELLLSVVTPDAITVQPGIYYNGSVRVAKITDTSLSLGTAGDWASGGSERATSTKGYVVGSASGSIKLTTETPTLSDANGNSDGELKYSVIGGNNWRVLDWFYMDAIGSGNLTEQSFGSWGDVLLMDSVLQEVYFEQTQVITGSTIIPYDDTIPQNDEGDEYMSIVVTPQSTTSLLKVEFTGYFAHDNFGSDTVAIFKDAVADALGVGMITCPSSNVIGTATVTVFVTSGTVDPITFKVRAGGSNVGNLTFNGSGGARKFGGTLASNIRVTEYKR